MSLSILTDKSLSSGTIEIKVPKVCLTMIVKNESKIIERCLTSAKDFIDCVCITDTGSTDDTISIINEWCEKHEIPCKVPESPFEGFGASRTRSFLNTKKYFPEADYCLLLDADMILEVPNFDKATLTEGQYLLYQYNSCIRYTNSRIISTRHQWKVECRTHEFWASPDNPNTIQVPFENIRILDLNDGGCKSDKFERDIKLLKLDIKDGIQVARSYFYLAQSYKDTGQHLKAIKYYKKRITAGAWFDEIWYSHVMIGKCYLRMAEAEKDEELEAFGIRYCLLAAELKHNRAEPLMELSTHFRKQGKNFLSYHFAKTALDCDPKGETLFVEQVDHSWGPLNEISITAYYLGKKDEGRVVCEKLLKEYGDKLPGHTKAMIESNYKFYKPS